MNSFLNGSLSSASIRHWNLQNSRSLFTVSCNITFAAGIGSKVILLLACSRLRDSGESVNWEKERQKKAKGLGRDNRPHFSRSRASSFRVPFLIFVPSQPSEGLEQAILLLVSNPSTHACPVSSSIKSFLFVGGSYLACGHLKISMNAIGNVFNEIWYIVNRGYYTAARRYEFYFRVVKTIFYERAQRVSKILFFTKWKLNSYLQAAV